MAFHNIRDKYGRFTKKKAAPKPRAKKQEQQPLATILNVFLLDDSGSMQGKVDATISGFNELLDTCKKATETTGVKYRDILVTFGELLNYSWTEGGIYLSKTSEHGKRLYKPYQGGTALYDAVLDSIHRTNNLLKIDSTTEYKVVLTVFTDGQNNVNNYKQETVKKAVEAQRALGWVINFIGAGDEKYIERQAASIGIHASNTASYQNTSAGTRSVLNKMSVASSTFADAVAKKIEKNIGFFANK